MSAFSDAIYTCPIRRLAHTAPGPVWRYLYTHRYEGSDFLGAFRATHFFDDPLRWNDVDLLSGFGPYELTPDEEPLSAKMTSYWTNFAKTGDPNGSGLPVWPEYDTVDEPTLTLDVDSDVLHGYHRSQCALMDSLSQLFPDPWSPGVGPANVPPGFLFERAGGR